MFAVTVVPVSALYTNLFAAKDKLIVAEVAEDVYVKDVELSAATKVISIVLAGIVIVYTEGCKSTTALYTVLAAAVEIVLISVLTGVPLIVTGNTFVATYCSFLES
jgi:hypothetical protein